MNKQIPQKSTKNSAGLASRASNFIGEMFSKKTSGMVSEFTNLAPNDIKQNAKTGAKTHAAASPERNLYNKMNNDQVVSKSQERKGDRLTNYLLSAEHEYFGSQE
jgi:hypothetical protein